MESLTQEQYKLVQMGTIKYTKYQSLDASLSNQSKDKNKSKDSKKQRVKEKKHSDEESSISTDEDSKSKRMKSKREKPKCGYYRGSHHEKYCFRNNLEIMTKLLEDNNIDVPDFAKREEDKLSLEQEYGKRL